MIEIDQAKVEKLLEAATYFSQAMHCLLSLAAPEPVVVQEDEFLTNKQAWKFLAVSKATFERAAKEHGYKPNHKIRGRFPRHLKSDLEKLRVKLSTKKGTS